MAKTIESTARTDECFTIMPFGGCFDDYYNQIFVRAIKSAGLAPRRVDCTYSSDYIVQDIWNYTKSCKLILADLTGNNPNVYYELGLAHAIAKPTILVTESIIDIPFDVQGLPIIAYDKNEPAWGVKLRKRIKTAILEVMDSLKKSEPKNVPHAFFDVKGLQRPKLKKKQIKVLKEREESEKNRRLFHDTVDGQKFDLIQRDEAIKGIRRNLEDGIPADMVFEHYVVRKVPPMLVQSEILRFNAERLRLADSKYSESNSENAEINVRNP